MSKHTPGPWEIRHNLGSSGVIVGGVMRQYTNGEAKDQIVMVLGLQEDNGGAAAKEANTRLIAAAPELLEMLDRCKDMLPECGLRHQVYELIAKVEGAWPTKKGNGL